MVTMRLDSVHEFLGRHFLGGLFFCLLKLGPHMNWF